MPNLEYLFVLFVMNISDLLVDSFQCESNNSFSWRQLFESIFYLALEFHANMRAFQIYYNYNIFGNYLFVIDWIFLQYIEFNILFRCFLLFFIFGFRISLVSIAESLSFHFFLLRCCRIFHARWLCLSLFLLCSQVPYLYLHRMFAIIEGFPKLFQSQYTSIEVLVYHLYRRLDKQKLNSTSNP